MAQMVQPGQMAIGRIVDVAVGGACAWRLPPDARCASVSRSLLGAAMTTLGLNRDLVDAAVLAVSELATNAFNHGMRGGPAAQIVPPELWVWARVVPAPQLVVTVFDTCRSSWPDVTARGLLDEHGKGIGIVDVVADAWGAHLSRSWLGDVSLPGKTVWSAFGLPGPWPDARLAVQPSQAARSLAATLAARGIAGIELRHAEGVSLVCIPFSARDAVNVWVEPDSLAFATPGGARVRCPVVNLHDVAEHLVCRFEECRADSDVLGKRPG